MQPDTRQRPASVRRAAAAGVPVALAGSLAMLMSATPAHAEPARSVDSSAPPLHAELRGTAARVPTPSSVRVPIAATPETYEVQAGDSVSTIAARHGLRTTDVLAINGLSWSSTIYPGQVLRLAAATAPEPAPPAAAAPAAPAAPAAGAHVVAGGDTISAIARLHGVSIQAVLSANGLGWSSIIYPGQSIAIPGAAAPLPAEPATPVAAPAPPAAGAYVVAGGDTISAIARLHGVSTQAILDANGLNASSIIHPGQSIAVPSAASPVLVANTTTDAAATTLDAEQVANARIIISVGRELGVPDRGIAIGLGTAMQESWLRNLDWGDRDSLGMFQQRPSTGWGTPEQVRDAARAARTFFGGPSDPNGYLTRGLLDVQGWQELSFADAAQSVQISAHPDRYAQWEQPASAWLAALG